MRYLLIMGALLFVIVVLGSTFFLGVAIVRDLRDRYRKRSSWRG